MREIVLDTETTGLDPNQGHRLVEIGCIELLNRIPTGATFHRYLNPERDMPAEAFAIHGLVDRVPQGQAAVRRDRRRVPRIHRRRAAGDPQRELRPRLSQCRARAHRAPPIARERLVDTLMLARRKHPGGPNRLDALCVRYGIDNSRRTKHGALLDAEILAEVYLELIGARQAQLGLAESGVRRSSGGNGAVARARTRSAAGAAHQRRRARSAPRLRREARRERGLAELFVTCSTARARRQPAPRSCVCR